MENIKIFLVLSTVLFFTACGGGGSSDGGATPVSTETPQTIAIDKIKSYAGDSSEPVPTIDDYFDVGVTGVTEENIDDINSLITSLSEEDVDTKEEIQVIVDELEITLPDLTPPVITLNGMSSVEITVGESYSDAGATATDDQDGIVPVTVSGNVDTSMIGTYTITYTAVDSAGNSAVKTRSVLVLEAPNSMPTANAGVDKTTEVNMAVTITGSGSDSDGTIVSYEWRFGSTVIGTTAEINYTPTTSGDHTLTLTVTDDDGATDSDSMIVTVTEAVVLNQAPTANAGPDKSVEAGQDVVINGSGSDSDGTIVAYEWKNGSTVIGTYATLLYRSLVIGNHTLTLTVTDNEGATGVDTVVVTVIKVVTNQAPAANAGADKTTEVGEPVVITGSGSDSDGSIVAYEWKEGTAVLGTTATITYTPTTAGTHTLTLTVTDDDGARGSDTMRVTATAEYVPYDVPPIDNTTKQAYLDAVNDVRAKQQDCGIYGMMGPVSPLVWSDALYKSAYEHSNDMMQSDTFSHTGSGTEHDWTAVILDLGRGSTPTERMENNGYTNWTYSGENIAGYKGYFPDELQLVMDGWIESDGHCRNLMSPNFEEIGMAHVENGSGNYTDYWTQNFGRKQ